MASKKPSGSSVSPLKALIVAALKGGSRANKQGKSARAAPPTRGRSKATRGGKRG